MVLDRSNHASSYRMGKGRKIEEGMKMKKRRAHIHSFLRKTWEAVQHIAASISLAREVTTYLHGRQTNIVFILGY